MDKDLLAYHIKETYTPRKKHTNHIIAIIILVLGIALIYTFKDAILQFIK